MAIATASEFARHGILSPIGDIFSFLYGSLEIMLRHITPNHPDFIYSHLAVILWAVKFLSAVIGVTANNGTLIAAFNDALHTLSVNSHYFFGNISGDTGMSYIAKHSYLELTNNTPLAEDLSVKFARALNSTIIFVMKAFEYL